MRELSINGLGLCEHCNVLLTIEDLSGDAAGTTWHCPQCKGHLTHASFGYDRGGKGAQKIRWVGPDGTWVDQRPESEFTLGEWLILIPPPGSMW